MERARLDSSPGPGPRDGQAAIRVADDRMSAALQVVGPEPGGRALTADEVMARLREAGVVFGVNAAAVQRAVQSAPSPLAGAVPEWITVAQGRLPEPGQDAQVEYHPALAGAGGRPKVRPDGSVDLFDLGLVRNVPRGTVLATKTPATPGATGHNVSGQEVTARPGRDVPLRVTRGAALSEDGLSVVAETDGHAVLVGHKVGVTPIYVVDGDVDPGTGNIRFIGSVTVRGNVAPGLWVKAEGDVEIMGGVDGGTIEAGGNVAVRYGIQGAGRGRVLAGGSVRARFIENAEVRAGTDVWVTDGILHSRVEAGGRVEALGKRGAIVGGRVTARDAVAARFLGAAMGTPTEVAVGIAPTLRDEAEEARKQLVEVEESLRRTQQAISLLKEQEKRGPLPDEKQQMLAKLLRGQYHLTARRQELVIRRGELDQAMDDARAAWVKAQDMCYPGVRLVIGNAPYVVTDLLHRTLFHLSERQEVQIGPI